MELEGLRGIAAIVVVIHHFVLAFFPFLIMAGAVQHNRLEDNIFGTPISLLYAGTFAVAIFFVLSGFVLSIGFFQTKDESIVKKLAAKRYLRLMLPAAASVIVCFLLLSFGASNIIVNTSAVTASPWLTGTWDFHPDFLDTLFHGTIEIFIKEGSPLNNVLWTMKTEFLGSFLIFGFLIVMAKSKYRAIGYGALAVFTFNTWFLPFVLGMAIADLYAHGFLERMKNKWAVTITLIGGAVLFGSYPTQKVGDTLYGWMQIKIPGMHVNTTMLYLTIGAVMIVLAVLVSQRLGKWLGRPRVSSLGKYTFALYLTHLAVLYTFTSVIFINLHEQAGYSVAVIIAFVSSVPVWAGVTYLFEKYVDAPSIRFSKAALEFYEGSRSLPSLHRYYAQVQEDYHSAKATWQARVLRVLTPTKPPVLVEQEERQE